MQYVRYGIKLHGGAEGGPSTLKKIFFNLERSQLTSQLLSTLVFLNNVPFVRFQLLLMAFSKYHLIQKFKLFILKHIILNGNGTFWNELDSTKISKFIW